MFLLGLYMFCNIFLHVYGMLTVIQPLSSKSNNSSGYIHQKCISPHFVVLNSIQDNKQDKVRQYVSMDRVNCQKLE